MIFAFFNHCGILAACVCAGFAQTAQPAPARHPPENMLCSFSDQCLQHLHVCHTEILVRGRKVRRLHIAVEFRFSAQLHAESRFSS